MRVWLIKEGEPLPIDPGEPRLLRMGLLADVLSHLGHEVTYWTSTLDFRTKEHRRPTDATVHVNPNYTIELLKGPAFRRHVSLGRIRYYNVLTRKLAKKMREQPRPDLVLCAYPTIAFALAAVKFGQETGVPVVIDVRDLWPDIFNHRLPSRVLALGKPLLNKMHHESKQVFAQARAITGITSEIVDWAIQKSQRPRSPWDEHFFHAFPEPKLSDEQFAKGREFWEEKGISDDPSWLTVCYLGQLTRTVEFETVARAFETLQEQGAKIRLVIVGAGDRSEEFIARAARLRNVHFCGWVGAVETWCLMQRSDVGLLCYHSTFDYEASFPNKAIEYMAGALPVLSSVHRGVLKNFIEKEGCGEVYENPNHEQLAKTLLRWQDNADDLRSMGRRARHAYEQHFVGETTYRRFAEHLIRIAGESASPTAAVMIKSPSNARASH